MDLFFVLSGFILMHTHRHDFAAPTRQRTQSFYALRFFRVYPINAVVLLGMAALALVDQAYAATIGAWVPGRASAVAFFKTLTLSTAWLLPGEGSWNQPVWSLSVEIVGYAYFPVAAWVLTRVRSGAVAAGLAIAPLLLLTGYLVLRDHLGANLSSGVSALVRMSLEFCAGMALQRAAHLLTLDRRGSGPALASVGAIMAIGLGATKIGGSFEPFAFALLILGLAAGGGGLVERALSHPVAMMLGKLSFPFYLLHVGVIVWFAAHLHATRFAPGTSSLTLAAVVLVSFVLAKALSHYVERPLNRAVHRRFAVRAEGPRSFYGARRQRAWT